jgi:hypothetical protein
MTKIPEILPGGPMPSTDAIRVAIVAYDGVSLLDLCWIFPDHSKRSD